MNTLFTHMIRRAAPSGVALGTWLATAMLAAPMPATAADIALYVEPLRDGGDLGNVTQSKKPLNEDLTQGLKTRLSETGKGRFDVVNAPLQGDAGKQSRYVLSGVLTGVPGAGTKGASGYKLELELSQLFPKVRPVTIARWSGQAQNLRVLSDDLRDKSVPVGGLTGEMARRISRQLALRDAGDAATFASWSQSLEELPVSVLKDGAPQMTVAGVKPGNAELGFVLPPRSAFQLRATEGDGTFHLFTLDEKGEPTAVGAPVEARGGATLPAGRPLAGLSKGNQNFVVLLRQKKERDQSGSRGLVDDKARLQPVPAVAESVEWGTAAVSGTETVLEALPASEKTGYQAILDQAASDASGLWVARRIRINFADSAKPGNIVTPAIPLVPPSNVKPPTIPLVPPSNVKPPANANKNANLFDWVRQDANGGLKMEVLPQKGGDNGPLKVGDSLKLRFTAPRAGYLVVLEMGTSGKVRSWFPEALTIDQRHSVAVDALPLALGAGKAIMVPMPDAEGATFSLQVTDPGTQRFKAWLFSEPADALRVVETLHRTGSSGLKPVVAGLQFDAEASQLKTNAQKEVWMNALKGAKIQSKRVGIAEITLEIARADRAVTKETVKSDAQVRKITDAKAEMPKP